MKNMIANGYQDARPCPPQRKSKPGWPSPTCSKADKDAEYAAVIEIDRAEITEPSLLPERPGRRQVPVRSGRHQDR